MGVVRLAGLPGSETARLIGSGAALTYARSATHLFTLVGIAGEDDLDAPDLSAVVPPCCTKMAD